MKTKTIISAKPLNYLISVLCLLMLSFVPVKDIQTDISFVKSNSKIDICDTEAGSIPEGYNLIYEQDFENHKALNDFVFACEVKFDKSGNSGIQIRSRQRERDGLVTGYQIEIDHSDRRWSGGLYEERGRGWFTPLVGDGNGKAREAFNLQEWNTIVIKAQGNHIQTWVNGVPIADFYDNDKKLSASEGFFGLQVHWPVKPEWTGKLRWRNLRIRELDNNLKQ